MLQADHIDTQPCQHRADGNSRNQIAEHRAEAEFRRHRHGDHPGDQKDKGEYQKIFHVSYPPVFSGRLSAVSMSAVQAALISSLSSQSARNSLS